MGRIGLSEANTMNDNIELNETVLRRMRMRIYTLERENQKTKAYSDKDMKAEIIKIIEEEIKKCY